MSRRKHSGDSAATANGCACVRDNASLTRPAYVEANLRQLFEAEDFADFAALWLLIHVTRFGAVGCACRRLRP